MTISYTKRRKPVNTELKNAVKAADKKAQYDEMLLSLKENLISAQFL